MVESFVSIESRIGLDQETVYDITKAWWAGVESQRENSPWLAQIKLEGAFDGMATPLHAGAIKYYQEIGMEIPEKLVPAECAYGNDGMVTCSAN